MDLRQPKLVHVEIQIPEVVMRFGMPRVVFQGVCKTVKGFDRVPVVRLDNAQVAISISNAVLPLNRFVVKLSSACVFPFIQHECHFEKTPSSSEVEDLCFRLRK